MSGNWHELRDKVLADPESAAQVQLLTETMNPFIDHIQRLETDIDVYQDALKDILDLTTGWSGGGLDAAARLNLIDKIVRDLLGYPQ